MRVFDCKFGFYFSVSRSQLMTIPSLCFLKIVPMNKIEELWAMFRLHDQDDSGYLVRSQNPGHSL